ncbi:hypothetical protein WME75_31920 [Sorangium sp. So ce1014]|uniref:hypothetical protein n=1 Tax=Sorangium sp. So ce1014 TaxID=3133326 RepID=UPI003F63A8EE
MFVKGLLEGIEAARRTEHFRILDESRTKKLMVFSDFSARASGRWATSVLLFTSEKAATSLTKTIRRFRKEHGLQDGRRFEYKSLRDERRWRVLDEWLRMLGRLRGVVVILVADIDVVSAFKVNTPQERLDILREIADSGFGDWSETRSGGRLLEDALRTMHIIGFMHALLTGGRSDLRWICDNDDILDGTLRRTSASRLLPAIIEKYSGFKRIVEITTEAALGTSALRDFLSVPDLLAAAILEYHRGTDQGASDMIAKAAVVMEWLGIPKPLQVISLQLTPHENGGIWWKAYRPYCDRSILVGRKPAQQGPAPGSAPRRG